MMHPLSATQRKVARMLRDGHTLPEIQGELGVSMCTVREHLHQVFVRLGVRNQVELAAVLLLPLDSPLRRE